MKQLAKIGSVRSLPAPNIFVWKVLTMLICCKQIRKTPAFLRQLLLWWLKFGKLQNMPCAQGRNRFISEVSLLPCLTFTNFLKLWREALCNVYQLALAYLLRLSVINQKTEFLIYSVHMSSEQHDCPVTFRNCVYVKLDMRALTNVIFSRNLIVCRTCLRFRARTKRWSLVLRALLR